jgi:PDZ domain-containing secreted protein
LIVKKPRVKNYINNRDFHNALMNFYQKCEENTLINKSQPNVPNYIGECILHIANNLSRKSFFFQYTFKEEMIYDAVEKMVEAVRYSKFDPSLSENPFAYFSQISWNSFLQRIEKEKKYNYTKHKNMEHMLILDNDAMLGVINDDNHNKVIEDYEKPKTNTYAKHRNLSYERHKPKEKKVIDV